MLVVGVGAVDALVTISGQQNLVPLVEVLVLGNDTLTIPSVGLPRKALLVVRFIVKSLSFYARKGKTVER